MEAPGAEQTRQNQRWPERIAEQLHRPDRRLLIGLCFSRIRMRGGGSRTRRRLRKTKPEWTVFPLGDTLWAPSAGRGLAPPPQALPALLPSLAGFCLKTRLKRTDSRGPGYSKQPSGSFLCSIGPAFFSLASELGKSGLFCSTYGCEVGGFPSRSHYNQGRKDIRMLSGKCWLWDLKIKGVLALLRVGRAGGGSFKNRSI